MTKNVFAFDDVTQPAFGAPRQQPTDPKSQIDGLAGQYRVPANVLLALREAGSQDAAADARRIADAIKTGGTVEDAVRGLAGQGVDAILSRAYDIADQMYPVAPGQGTAVAAQPAPAEPSTGWGQLALGAVQSGVGMAGSGLARGGDFLYNQARQLTDLPETEGGRTIVGLAVQGFTDAVKAGGEARMDAALTDADRAAMQDSQISGDLTAPSTWSAGADPSLRGYALQATQVFGQMAPVVAAALATGGLGAAAVGAGQSMDAAATQVDQALDEMAATPGPDGRPRIETESQVYRGFIAQGMDPAAALEATKRQARDIAGPLAALVGGAGGALTSRIVSPGVGALTARSVVPRVAGTAALSSVEEGTQEAVEGMATRYGMNQGAGTDQSVTGNTFGDFAMGAMAGAPLGAVAGAAQRQTLAPVAGRQIGDDEEQNALADGSGQGQPPAMPALSPSPPLAGGASSGAVPPPSPALPPPSGPIGAAARVAPDLTPVPEAPPPPVRFPDQKAGAEVDLMDPETGVLYDAVFIGETPDGGVTVRVDGNEVDLTAQEFDQMRTQAKRAPDSPQETPRAEVNRPAQKRGGLAAQAQAAVVPPPPRDDTISPEQAARALAAMEDMARDTGWTPALKRRYQQMQDIAGVDTAAADALQDMGYNDGPWNDAAPVQQPDRDGELRGAAPDDLGAGRDATAQPDVAEPVLPRPEPAPAGAGDANAVATAGGAGEPASTVDTTPAAITIEPIRAKAAVLRGVPQDRPPTVDGVSLKWDEAVSGFIFARKHSDKVRTAMRLPVEPAAAPAVTHIDMAAAQANPDPTDGQKEAGNYAMGHARWQGLGLSIETPRGAMRRGKGRDGAEWAVKMPAHYGYIKRTEGADGDHVDIYMGNEPDSPTVIVVDQVDAETGKFDEHKVMLGFRNRKAALDTYVMGFSDGRGQQRIGSHKVMSVPEFKEWLDTGDKTKPAGRFVDPAGSAPRPAAPRPAAPPTPQAPAVAGMSPLGSATAEPAPKSARARIGTNADGNPLFEDERKVRSYVENGVRASETVRIVPTRDGGVALGSTGRNRDSEFLTEAERVAQSAPEAIGQDTPATNPTPEAAPPPTYGAKNTLVTADRAAELRARLKAKLNTELRSGIDPEILAIGAELAAFHIEAGARRFADFAAAIARDLDTTPQAVRRYLRAWYNGARDMMEDAGLDIAGMDDAAAVREELAKIPEGGASPAATEGATLATPQEAEGDEQAASAGVRKADQGREPRAAGEGRPDGQPVGDVSDRVMGDGPARPDGADAGVGVPAATRPRRGGSPAPAGGGTDPVGVPPERRPRTGVDRSGDDGAPRDRVTTPARSNYRITDPEALFAGGPKARFAKNRAAMETLASITDENREPTPAELDVLAAFTGWGSFGQELFRGSWDQPAPKPEWKAESDWLRDHLGKEGWQSAQTSIINAHYTDPPTVQAIWSALQAMGFNGGRILEPAMGVGNFFGMMPEQVAANSELHGIELEQSTGRIAKMLYPRANIRIMGYEKSKVPDGFYDLVIGNWPFANVKMSDRRYDRLSPSLHDYFFVKAMDQVRPGGLVVGITSAFSMDGQRNRGIRAHLAKQAELVASFRLPSGAFEKYAGTKVVTDLIILKRREAPLLEAVAEPWVDTEKFKTPSGDEINLNRYYVQNPRRVLGTIDSGSGTTYGQRGMIVVRPDDIATRLQAIAAEVPKNAYTAIKRGKEERFAQAEGQERRFALTVGNDGGVYQVLGDVMQPLADAMKMPAGAQTLVTEIKALIGLRRAADAVLTADRDGAPDADAKRAALKKAYQAFRKAHGRIADSAGLKAMRKLRDPNEGMVAALETRSGDPSPLMDRATVRAARQLEQPTIRDAYVMLRNQSTILDLPAISAMAKVSEDAVRTDLLASKAIYRTPGGGYEPADVYLSGNVRTKLREALDAAEQGEDMAASVEALRAVQPPDVPYHLIEARFGADWVPVEVTAQFARQQMGLPSDSGEITLRRGVTGWGVEVSERVAHLPRVIDMTGAPLPGRRSTGLSLRRFLEATLNTQTLTVKYEDDDGTHVDQKATEQANAKAQALREKFGEWLWADAERRVDMERAYNDIMNAIATPQVDGSFLEFPGLALTKGDAPFNLRSHQQNAIWRGVLNQRGIYAHEVGTGKTLTMAGIAVESRRYGLAKKPLLIAHNANSRAVAAEAQEAYPGARILYIDNLAPAEINAELSRIANEDWDLIVMPHSLLDRLALTRDTLMAMAAEDIAAYEREAIEAAEAEGIKITVEDLSDEDELKKKRLPITAKEMVKARQRLLQAIEAQAARASREGAIPFERLGVDTILVDEAHEFKKPPIATRMQVKGLNTATSNKALALRFLTDYVKALRGGTGVHLFTGTPITNTLPEVYHQMRYVMDDVMRQSRIDTWDGFFKTFADTVADVERTSAGDYENVERLAAFVNVSELRRMAGQYLDIVFADEMPEFKPRATPNGKTLKSPDLTDSEREYLESRMATPETAQGRPYKKIVTDIGPMGADQKRILQQVMGYARAFRAAKGKERMEIMKRGGPDAPIVYDAVPNRASMDARLHEPDAEDHPQSKANRAVRNIARIYLDEPMATQVLFMDEGYSDQTTAVKTLQDGSKSKTVKKINLAADIVAKLVDAGVKREEIAIVAGGVSAEEKKAIADAMNERRIRIVIGQTKTLGVGVNMQRYLRAMHHLDAPWMPGDLEQRNGRGERQGNLWNTVLEYRYLTEDLDARRWAVLSVKDRFIKAFLRAKDGLRVIEGDAVDDAEDMDAGSLEQTLSAAAGDPRLAQITKLKKQIEKLIARQRIHDTGMVEAGRTQTRVLAQIKQIEESLPPLRSDAGHVANLRDAGTFSATVNGKTFDKRPEAKEAVDAYLAAAIRDLGKGDERVLPVEVQGFAIKIEKPRWAFKPEDANITAVLKGSHNVMGPSLGSIESAIRRVGERLDKAEADLIEKRTQSGQLEKAKSQPFQRAGELKDKQDRLAAIESDLQANPVAAPSWLRVGAPVDSVIYVGGAERVVTGHRWTDAGWFVSTAEGDVPYLDAKTDTGVAIYEERPFEAPEVYDRAAEVAAAAAKEFRDDAAPRTPADFRAITADLNAMPEVAALGGRVPVRVVRDLLAAATGQQVSGRFNPADPSITVRAGAAAGERGVMRHEIIHALRAEELWGKPFGLFTREEWTTLVRAARADKALAERVARAYADQPTRVQTEEMVAEMYREWGDARDAAGPVARVFEKVRAFLQALASALRGRGFISAGRVMERIATGEVGGRGPDGPGGAPSTGKEFRDTLMRGLRKTKGPVGRNWSTPENWLTDAMSGRNGWNILALVPGRALFAELGKTLPSALRYLRVREELDALRNEWHARADAVAQEWRKARRRDAAANDRLMDLMHRTTLAGIDPSKPDTWKHAFEKAARENVSRFGPLADLWAQEVIAQIEHRAKTYAVMREQFLALPEPMQALYGKVRDEYTKMADDFDEAIMENMRNATRIALKRAEKAHRKEMARIDDDGLQGDERDAAIAAADEALAKVKKRGGLALRARLAALRKQFESNRLKGPYFPLARFGNYFVTIRNQDGEVISFSRFEKSAQQQAAVRQAKEDGYTDVREGVMSDTDALREQVSPTFLADVERMMAESGADAQVMDAVWQRWLETLPDLSVRTSKIHRKGRQGWNADAFRAFGKHMFHGAHQLARLKYGMTLEEHLDDAKDEARIAEDPNRAGLIVNEMARRHEFAMNPKTNPLLASASSLAFIWYLGVSPAAAMANLAQTTVVGPAIMAARFPKQGGAQAVAQLGRAMKDFGAGKGWIEASKSLTDDERDAMQEGYRRGSIDKTQAHDLASVADTGIEYNATRERIMRGIGFFFHHAERMNREVTFLAAYRMGKAEGLDHGAAVERAADVTWTVHFDYQNASRPRFMQNDIGRFLTMFRQFTVNMLWRLARDLHQTFNGKTAEERREARTQFIGITLSMMAHAGIRGTWGYGILMTMLGIFFPGGGGDDAEDWLQDALLVEGDDYGTAAWNWAMGAALNGLPGHVTGTALSERIGMPNLWFRGPGRDLEGRDLYAHYLNEIGGPVVGIGAGMFAGFSQITEDPYRAVEQMVPKFIRDVMKTGRYGWEGVTTRSGDDVVAEVTPLELFVQANGFTPARVAERYTANTRMKNREMRLMDERSGIQHRARDQIIAGEALSEDVIKAIRDWNAKYPAYPITADTLRQSVGAKRRATERNEFGIQINPRLNEQVRGAAPPMVYN